MKTTDIFQEKFDDFKEKIVSKINNIDMTYKKMKEYVPNEKELTLKSFLEDIWEPRFEDSSLNSRLDNAVVLLLFISKENPNNVFSKNFRIKKMHPKGKNTTPLWYLIAKLAEDNKDYNFYFSPNMFFKTRDDLTNGEHNIIASNSFFIDIDSLEGKLEKPIYNCTEQEIKEYLEKTYPFIKESGYSYVTMSGRGLHIYFTLEYTEYLFASKYRNYRRMEHRKLTEEMIQITGADAACKNLNRVLRVPFSINRKMNIRSRLYMQEENCKKYSRQMLQEYLKPFKEFVDNSTNEQAKVFEKKKRSKENISEIPETEYTEMEKNELSLRAKKGKETLYKNRKADLEEWYNLHRSDMKGRRHYFFLIYIMTLRQLEFAETYIKKKCFYLNDGLIESIPENEILRIIYDKKRYLFRNESIADLLNFTQREITSFKCNYSDEEIKEHRQEKNDYFHQLEKEKRQIKKQEKQEEIFRIIDANTEQSMSELAEILKCSKSTAWRWYQKYIKSCG